MAGNSMAMDIVHETQLDAAKADARLARKEVTIERATRPNNPIARLATANVAAAITTLIDSQIGKGDGDGVKIGTVLGATGAAAMAYRAGHFGIYNALSDAAIGASCAQTTLATRDYGLKMAQEREKKRAAAQQQQAAAPAAK